MGDIVAIFNKFDADKSGYLERGEFIELLKEYNKGQTPKDEEIQWMLNVADKNEDDKISKSELLYAMQAWYGYTHMSKEFSDLFEKFDKDGNGYLDPHEFAELLTQLNDGKPV